jgi:3-oxoacyl-[acyl-carrier-protein] synthase-3
MRLISTGSSLPENYIRSEEIERALGLEVGWIERRTGIKVKPVASADQATSDLAVCAAKRALLGAQIDFDEIGLLILATSTPDYPLPPTAPQVAHRLGLRGVGAIDLAGACSGFIYALALADSYGEIHKCASLIIGANVLSRRVDPNDPATASLFSDGAGACVLAPGEGLLSVHLGSDGEHWNEIVVYAGGSREPLTTDSIAAKRHLMRMKDGANLFRRAVRRMAEVGLIALEKAGITIKDVDWWIPHQANRRMIQEAGKLMGISKEKTIDVISRCGNSSAATIPIAIDIAISDGRLKNGDILLLTSVGAGMLEAAAVLKLNF